MNDLDIVNYNIKYSSFKNIGKYPIERLEVVPLFDDDTCCSFKSLKEFLLLMLMLVGVFK